MNTHHRIFRVEGGPLAEAIAATADERQRTADLYVELGEKMGCTQVHTWPWTGRFAGCSFPKGKEPPLATWRKSHKVWVPRKKTTEGDEWWSEISKLPPIPAMQTVLEQYGLTVHKEQVSGGGPSYVEGFVDKGVHYVHVPWFNVTEEMVKLAIELDGELTGDLKFIKSWEQPIDWVEVATFQKVIEWDELNRQGVI